MPNDSRNAIIMQLKVMKDEFSRYFHEIRKLDFNLFSCKKWKIAF